MLVYIFINIYLFYYFIIILINNIIIIIILYYFIGTKIHLNILLKDQFNIQRYYHLQTAEIPIQQTEETFTILPNFIELLLNLRVCFIYFYF